MTTAEVTKVARKEADAAHAAAIEILDNDEFMTGVLTSLGDPTPGKTLEQIDRELGLPTA